MNGTQKRVIRTAFQTLVSVVGIVLVAVPALLGVLGDKLSPEQYGVVAGAGAAVVGVASATSRIMHAPAVIGFLDTYAPWLSASEIVADHVAERFPDLPTSEYPVVTDPDATQQI